jgi:hypothetical protein
MLGRGRSVLIAWLAGAAVVAAATGCKGSEMAILDVNPRTGSTQGDQPVHIVGKNFRQDIGYTVYFGTKKTTSVTIRDPETIEVLTPPSMPEGKVDIMIRVDDGSAYRIADAFHFQGTGENAGQGLGATPAKKNQKGNLAY